MKYVLIILLFASCTATKTFLLDGSKSEGNIVKYEWKINDRKLSNNESTTVDFKQAVMVKLIVTDSEGRKDSAILKIR